MHESVPIPATAGAALASQVDDLNALYQLTDKLYRARSLADVYDAALDAIVTTLGCRRASILLFDEAGVMRFVAWRGLSEGYRKAVGGHSPWKPGDREPQPIFVSDIELTEEPDWIKTAIISEGIRGLAFIPLVCHGAVIGKFMTYHEAPHNFAQHEVNLAVTIARQVGFSLERAQAEAARRTAEDEMRESEERFRLMSEHAPVMIWLSGVHGECLHLNRMLRNFWNVDENAIDRFDWQVMVHPEDAPEIGRLMREALARHSSVTIKGRYLDSKGRYRIMQTDARPRFSAKGEFLGMIGVNVDITERDEAESQLRESEERFRLAVEAAPSGMVMTDGEGRIVMVNAHAETLFGYGRDELTGEKIELLVPARFKASHPAYREAYSDQPRARPMGAGRDLFARRKDGSEVAVEIGLSPIDTAEGTMTLAAVVDISCRKRAESQRELLLAELNHRVKNTLAVVQGIAHQTFKDTDPGARKAFEGRLVALAVAHDLLTEANWENASLQQLAVDTLHLSAANGERVSLSGPRVLLPPREALALAMALHELYTNAVKYGALSNDTGRIALEWNRTVNPQTRLELVWREHGGPPVSPPKRRGFGSLLLDRTLAHDLDGTVAMEFKPQGLVCSIVAPLPKERFSECPERQEDPRGRG
jgi:PAS domain S-box-containing protein